MANRTRMWIAIGISIREQIEKREREREGVESEGKGVLTAMAATGCR